MNDHVNNPRAETRCWTHYDPESVVGEFGWLWHRTGDDFEWHLIQTIEDDETDALIAWMVGHGDGHTSNCVDASLVAGRPYLPCLAPSIYQEMDQMEVIVRMADGASAAHAFGPGEHTERIEAALKAILNFGTRNTAAIDVLAERRRQIEDEGFTPERDDAHEPGQLAEAASYYAWHALDDIAPPGAPIFWPLEPGTWKPTTARRDLIKAAALIVAEIERLDREEARDD